MTPQKQSRSSALFLTELTLAILFFAAASSVCVQIFVKSHLLSLHSRQLNLAVNESAAIAELIEASDSMEEAVALSTARYPLAEIAATSTDTVEKADDSSGEEASAGTANGEITPHPPVELRIFYDKELAPCESDSPDATLVLSVTLSQENRELDADLRTQAVSSLRSADAVSDGSAAITASDRHDPANSDAIYTLQLSHHLQRRASHES